jgi:metal-responsive CopG/Arc/MetJ family transcriptional regulator
MARAKKIAITVDGALLARAEHLRRTTEESRSAVFARALRGLLREEERRSKITAYVEGYRRMPETEAEVAWVDAASVESLRDVPWDDG